MHNVITRTEKMKTHGFSNSSKRGMDSTCYSLLAANVTRDLSTGISYLSVQKAAARKVSLDYSRWF